MDQFIAAALAWIVVQMGAGSVPPPRVDLVPAAELQQMAAAEVPGAGALIDQQSATLGGLYATDSDTVYLPDSFDLSRLEDRATLVHELVHYVQDQSGMANLPVSAIESQAYDLQYRWRDEASAGMPAEDSGSTVAVQIETRGAAATGSRQVKTFAQR